MSDLIIEDMEISSLFIFTFLMIYLTIAVEDFLLLSEHHNKKITQIFGKNAFLVHKIITEIFWIGATIGILSTTLQDYPTFHSLELLSILGWICMIIGLTLATLGYKELGMDRSAGVNFYNDDPKYHQVITSGIYRYMKHPEEHGFWLIMIGFAIGTYSSYNLVFAFEFILLMINHQKIENLPFHDTSNYA